MSYEFCQLCRHKVIDMARHEQSLEHQERVKWRNNGGRNRKEGYLNTKLSERSKTIK